MFLENLVSEALPWPGVWARQAASDCRAALPDEPGLARSQTVVAVTRAGEGWDREGGHLLRTT